MGAQLHRQRLTESLECPLGCVIGTEPRKAHDATDARDLDDVTRALRPQEGERGSRHAQRAEEIDIELPMQFLVGDLLDGPDMSVTGIVDDDVQAAEGLVRRLHGTCHRGAVDDVDLEG